MIVGFANDIFVYNMAKWLKAKIDKITIDIIEYNDSSKGTQDYGFEYYDSVTTMPQSFFLHYIPFVRNYTIDWDKCRQLKKMLKGKHFDIIQCHYVLGLYANATYLKEHCNRLYFSFWGGDKYSKYLGSTKLFREKIKNILLNYSDGLINGDYSTARNWAINDRIPTFYRGNFGSAPLENLFYLLEKESHSMSKEFWHIPPNKLSVQLGYSGKEIHQYIEIVEELKKYDEYKNSIHLLVPMTRDRNNEYVDKVEIALKNSGYTYTLIKDRFLSDMEVAKLRNSVDVFLQLASRDGYSRSVIEVLFAGALVIYGEWLGYEQKFKRDGFYGISVSSIENACSGLGKIIDNFDNYSEMLKLNKEKANSKYLWSECINDWVAVYQGIAEPTTK